MAKAKPSKSAKIREALAATPDKSANEIAKEAGVSVALVYSVKAEMKKKGRKPKKKAAPKPAPKSTPEAPTQSSAPQSAHQALDAAFEFIHKVGGLFNAEQLIAKLKSFKERR